VIRLEDPTNAASRWMIIGDHYMIGGFQTKRHAEHFFSTRNGLPPSFDVTTVQSVKEGMDQVPDDEFDSPMHGVPTAAFETTQATLEEAKELIGELCASIHPKEMTKDWSASYLSWKLGLTQTSVMNKNGAIFLVLINQTLAFV
jgi:hypothetical protein